MINELAKKLLDNIRAEKASNDEYEQWMIDLNEDEMAIVRKHKALTEEKERAAKTRRATERDLRDELSFYTEQAEQAGFTVKPGSKFVIDEEHAAILHACQLAIATGNTSLLNIKKSNYERYAYANKENNFTPKADNGLALYSWVDRAVIPSDPDTLIQKTQRLIELE